MILIDLSQTLYSVLLQNQNIGVNLDLARSMIFTTLLSYKKKFGHEYGEPVLAIDSREGYWRKDVFPLYKANRKKARKDPEWKEIFNIVNTVTAELKEVLPWKIVYVPKAEADDIIAVLGMAFGHEKLLILSSDKDYKQLHSYQGIRQYSPIMKKWIETDNPKDDLDDLIIHGDSGDGIPNIRSPNNAFVDGIRQKPITKAFYKDLKEGKGFESVKDRFEENKLLIDFTMIPTNIRDSILEEYSNCKRGNINKLYQFLVANRMNMVLKDIDLFKVQTHELHPASEFFQ